MKVSSKNAKQRNTTKGSNIESVSNKTLRSKFPIIIVFCLPVLLYLQTINFGLTHFDDDRIISNNLSFLSDFRNVGQAFITDAFIENKGTFYRPLQTISYMVDVHLSGANNNWMFHLTNILLLGLIASILFLFIRMLNIPSKLAMLTTLFYCCHPLFVSSIAWIPARGDLMLTLFTLLSFLFLYHFLNKGKFIFLFLHWISFTIALFCKETAALLPILFIVFSFINDRLIDKKRLFAIFLYIISGLVWFWLRSKAIGDIASLNGTFGFNAIIQNTPTILESLSKFLLPISIAPIPSFSLLKEIIGFIIIIFLIILFFKNKDRFPYQKLFYLLWFILLLLPAMFYKQEFIDYLDHRFLLPLIGIILFILSSIPENWLSNGTIKYPWIIVSIILIMSSFTFIKTRSYSDPMNFYDAAINQNRNSSLAYNNRGSLKLIEGNYSSAINDFNEAIAVNPNHYFAYNNRGSTKANLGNYDGAISDFDAAINLKKDYAEAFNNRGNAKISKNNISGALDDFTNAIAINPNYIKAYYDRGLAYLKAKKYTESIEDFKLVTKRKPNDFEAYNNIGAAFGLLGNFPEAIHNLTKSIEVNPNYIDAYVNRALALYYIKDLQGTLHDCEFILSVNPNDLRILDLKTKVIQELKIK